LIVKKDVLQLQNIFFIFNKVVFGGFVGAFAKLQKMTISFVMCSCKGQIYWVIVLIWVFYLIYYLF